MPENAPTAEAAPVPTPSHPPAAWRDALLAIVVGLVAFGAVAVTINDVGLTYDEPVYFQSAGLMRTWLARAFGGGDGIGLGEALDLPTFAPLWRYEVFENRHPPLCGYLLNLSWLAFHRWLGEVAAYRLSSAILFGVLTACLYLEARRAWGRAAGLGAAAALVLMPRVFGHAHAAATDTPAMTVWFLTYMAFRRTAADDRPRAPIGRILLFGVLLGLGMLTKFTNWLIVLPLAVWALRFHRRIPWRWVWLALPMAGVVAVGLNPAWWRNPFTWPWAFVESSLSRGQGSAIATWFLGRTYAFALPWYNGPVLTLFCTPVITVALFLVGVIAVVRNRLRTPLGAMAAVTVAFFWIVRGLPTAPGHDGVRLFLPMFPFLAALAGAGVAWIAAHTRRPALTGGLLVGLVAAAGVAQVALIHPYHLSFYGEAAGGLGGARRLGLETTYWWDAATDEFFDLLNDDLPPNAAVFVIPGRPTLAYWQEHGRLRSDIRFVSRPEEFNDIAFLILLCRQGKFDPVHSAVPRPPRYTAEQVWDWYHRADAQWRVFAPRAGVPLVIIVHHGPAPLGG